MRVTMRTEDSDPYMTSCNSILLVVLFGVELYIVLAEANKHPISTQ